MRATLLRLHSIKVGDSGDGPLLLKSCLELVIRDHRGERGQDADLGNSQQDT